MLFRFVAVGASCAVFYFLVNYTLYVILDLNQIIAALVSYVFSFFVAYCFQKNWVFRSSMVHSIALPRYAIAQVVAAVVTAILSQVISEKFNLLSASTISAISVLIAGVCSFVLSFFWVFGNVESKPK